ncbi:hypothetical protein IJF86_00075 [Candidatus Saccharibacteria bacterium]|nr:hypothetical protein [Candidatus Saccharibacteria bacterium]
MVSVEKFVENVWKSLWVSCEKIFLAAKKFCGLVGDSVQKVSFARFCVKVFLGDLHMFFRQNKEVAREFCTFST